MLDEVHFLQDAYRGPVWEEVIIHLPTHVRLVCLSATVSNAAELAEWIETVRGATDVVVEERRPVQLDNFYYVADLTNDRLSAAADDRRRPPEPRRAAARRQRRAVPARAPRRSRAAGERAAQAGDPGPGRDRRGARRARSAAGDLLHLQPRPVRGGGARLRRRRAAPHRRRRTLADQRDRRRPGSTGCRPPTSRCSVTTSFIDQLDGRVRAAPRRDGAAVQGGRRGLLRRGAGEGRVRHRDAGGRDQHAGPQRGDREAHQVHRRPSRDAVARPVHPAHRPGRAARHRRTRRGGRAVEPVRHVRSGRRAGARASRSTCVRRSGRPSTWPPTWCARTTPRPPASC